MKKIKYERYNVYSMKNFNEFMKNKTNSGRNMRPIYHKPQKMGPFLKDNS